MTAFNVAAPTEAQLVKLAKIVRTVIEYKLLDRSEDIDFIESVRVESVRPMSSSSGHIYQAIVSLNQTDAKAIDSAMNKLDVFGYYETGLGADRPITVDGVDFILGDGDDGAAVEADSERGAVVIWLRHFG